VSFANLNHNHELIPEEMQLIKSYRKLPMEIWMDIKQGIEAGYPGKVIVRELKQKHPIADRATDTVLKNAIQKVKRECKPDKMRISFICTHE
jgi:hypothetical protein